MIDKNEFVMFSMVRDARAYSWLIASLPDICKILPFTNE